MCKSGLELCARVCKVFKSSLKQCAKMCKRWKSGLEQCVRVVKGCKMVLGVQGCARDEMWFVTMCKGVQKCVQGMESGFEQ